MSNELPTANTRQKKAQDTARTAAGLLRAAYDGDLERVKEAIEAGVPVDAVDDRTGLTALHLAAATKNLELVRYLVEECRAPFGPDKLGRWPTLLAARFGQSEELSDYIVLKEAEALRDQQLTK